MAEESRKPIGGTFTDALKSDPRENARRAEETLDASRRREQEEAMREKERTGPDTGEIVRDTTIDRPPD